MQMPAMYRSRTGKSDARFSMFRIVLNVRKIPSAKPY